MKIHFISFSLSFFLLFLFDFYREKCVLNKLFRDFFWCGKPDTHKLALDLTLKVLFVFREEFFALLNLDRWKLKGMIYWRFSSYGLVATKNNCRVWLSCSWILSKLWILCFISNQQFHFEMPLEAPSAVFYWALKNSWGSR